ncbi:MAG: SDR family NAD(P)-dependent oxidoreductase [Vulcanimicrobiaceae bacterium]
MATPSRAHRYRSVGSFEDGLQKASPLEALPMEHLRQAFEVNVFGQVAVTRALLDLLRRAKGRIVNIGSIGGHIAMPFIGALVASKFALEAINDVLRMELKRFEIEVIAVEPAAIRTRAVDTMERSIEPTIASFSEIEKQYYQNDFRAAMHNFLKEEHAGSPPEVVGAAILRALTDRRPKTRYFVGANATRLRILPKILPDRLLDRVRLDMLGIAPDQLITVR